VGCLACRFSPSKVAGRVGFQSRVAAAVKVSHEVDCPTEHYKHHRIEPIGLARSRHGFAVSGEPSRYS
jgi:hypothetical protein